MMVLWYVFRFMRPEDAFLQGAFSVPPFLVGALAYWLLPLDPVGLRRFRFLVVIGALRLGTNLIFFLNLRTVRDTELYSVLMASYFVVNVVHMVALWIAFWSVEPRIQAQPSHNSM
jgi:hypothetical protein